MSDTENPYVSIDGTNVHIDEVALSSVVPSERVTGEVCEEQAVLPLLEQAPRVTVYVGSTPVARYVLDPIAQNPSLAGKFLHASIRVLDNLGLMMDGLISLDERDAQAGAADDGSGRRFLEGVRFQPLFIGAAREKNAETIGQGLFARGLHFSGTVTPRTVRACCLCDHCGGAFSLEHVHTGFTGEQYFYCERGLHTVFVDPRRFPGCPSALQEDIDSASLAEVEARLPLCSVCGTSFRYFNPLRCRHCGAPYLDFTRFPEMRPHEYYGCTIVGEELH